MTTQNRNERHARHSQAWVENLSRPHPLNGYLAITYSPIILDQNGRRTTFGMFQLVCCLQEHCRKYIRKVETLLSSGIK